MQSTKGFPGKKEKVVFILGATATGKTRLSIDLATNLRGEIINSDKIQVYRGLDILTNKASKAERRGIPHHLFDFIEDPNSDFTWEDFIGGANEAMANIIWKGNLPIVVGGSNSYIEALVDQSIDFKLSFDPCFLWVDVALPVLYRRARTRVDRMVKSGLADEVKGMFLPGLDYTRGLWRATGFPEMEKYCLAEMVPTVDEATRMRLFEAAVEETKVNTCTLVDSQLEKIRRLRDELGWDIHRMDATPVAGKKQEEAEYTWREMVLGPSLEIVCEFPNVSPVSTGKKNLMRSLKWSTFPHSSNRFLPLR